MLIEPAFGTFGSVGRCQVLLENEISISIKLVSRRKHEVELPPNSGSLISKLNAKFTLIWKEDFGPLSYYTVVFLLSPGKMRLTMFLFQKWLGSSFPEDVWAWWLLMHWLQLQFTPCEALPSVWIGFAWLYSQVFVIPCCLSTFSYPISSFQSILHLICFDTALLEQPPPPSPLSVMTLCDLCTSWVCWVRCVPGSTYTNIYKHDHFPSPKPNLNHE